MSRPGILLIALLAGILPAVAAGHPAHYLVFELGDDGEPRLVFQRQVELAGPLRSRSDADLESAHSAATAGKKVWALQLQGPSGMPLFQDVIEEPQLLRGEFHGEQDEDGSWSIDGHVLPQSQVSFVVRVPAHPGARLVLDGRRGRATFVLDQPATGPPSDPVPVHALQTESVAMGSPANRVDLLIMGDGYTAAQESDFLADAATLEAQFFGVSPFEEYRNLVNVTALFTASAESGADHPPYDANCNGGTNCCKDAPAQNDPLSGTYMDTAFHGRYCANNIHRLLVVSTSAVYSAAAAYPDWDKILVLVHDSTYGGSGGSLSVSSTHSASTEVSRHEYGHSFTRLADEYESPYPGYPACSDVSSPACRANVTDEIDGAFLKWAPWVLPSTPLPTPETSTYNSVVGLFEGAQYKSVGMFRPRNSNCLMRSLNRPFCEICAQEYILQLYRGGWGTPSSGIDLIEPGSENPPTGAPVDGAGGVTLSAALLQPVGAPPLSVRWKVDGVAQPGPGASSYLFAPAGPGTYAVEMEVEDITPFVHPAMNQGLTITSRVWTVEVAPAPDPGSPTGLLTVAPAATPGNLVLSWGASCSASTTDYAIYEGSLGSFTSHTAVDCSDDSLPLSEEIAPASGDTYYLIVPYNTAAEGSYGTDSGAVERSPGLSRCVHAQDVTGCS
jgi:hypothetical protein